MFQRDHAGLEITKWFSKSFRLDFMGTKITYALSLKLIIFNLSENLEYIRFECRSVKIAIIN